MQPADVGWFRSLKNYYKVDWNNWFMNEPKKLTKHGNMSGPGYQRMINWIVGGWDKLEQMEITKSFLYCGLTSNNFEQYHSTLKKILESDTVPTNISIESKEKDEELFYDVFVQTCDDDDIEEDSDSDLSNASSMNSDSDSIISDISSYGSTDSDDQYDSNLEFELDELKKDALESVDNAYVNS